MPTRDIVPPTRRRRLLSSQVDVGGLLLGIGVERMQRLVAPEASLLETTVRQRDVTCVVASASPRGGMDEYPSDQPGSAPRSTSRRFISPPYRRSVERLRQRSQTVRIRPVPTVSQCGTGLPRDYGRADCDTRGAVTRPVQGLNRTGASPSNPATACMATSSPSRSQVRRSPSARTTASRPPRVASSRQPCEPGAAPEIVPDAKRSPARSVARRDHIGT